MNYFELEPENNTFKTLLADVTHRCNMKCSNCYIPNRTIPDMDKEKLFEFVRKLPKRTDIRMIGAEATLRKDLPEIISFIRDQGHRPTLLTNGIKMDSLSYCEELYNSGLKSLGISLNGAEDDKAYRILDGGNYAKEKLAALENCFKIGFVTHINCIVAKNVNESAPKKLLNTLEELCLKYNRRSGLRYPLMLRFKNIGQIGRYMGGDASMPIDELLKIICDSYELSFEQIKKQNQIDGYSECNAYLFPIETKVGRVFVKVTDWQVDDDGVPDSGSQRRGRITQDFKVAPFFEHVKMNENGY